MNPKIFVLGFAAALGTAVLVLASCDDRTSPVAVQAVAPVQAPAQAVVAQQPHDSFWQNVFLYHMIFGTPSQTVVHHYDSPRAYVPPAQSRTIVNNTTIVNRTVVKPAPVAPVPSYSAPSRSTIPSYSAPRPTAYSGSYSPRPSYSSYSSSSRSSYSSFSSGRR